MSSDAFVNKKATWAFLKGKVDSGNFNLDYKEYKHYYQVFIIDGSTRFFCNIMKDIPGLVMIGKNGSNEAELQDFLDNYKAEVDAKPPFLVQAVDLPKSMKLGDKITFHESSRPDTADNPLITCWTGAGDDVENHVMWGGDIMGFEMNPGESIKYIDVAFDPQFGDTWIHEAYGMWENASFGDYVNAYTMAPGVPLQQFIDLDLILDGNKVLYSPGGPGTGTHGFAANPAPVPSVGGAGAWDYSKETGLVPNFTGTGEFDIWTVERLSNQFIAKFPIAGTTYSYVMLQSADSAKLVPPFFLRIEAHNNSNTAWKLWMFLTVYRENSIDNLAWV